MTSLKPSARYQLLLCYITIIIKLVGYKMIVSKVLAREIACKTIFFLFYYWSDIAWKGGGITFSVYGGLSRTCPRETQTCHHVCKHYHIRVKKNILEL